MRNLPPFAGWGAAGIPGGVFNHGWTRSNTDTDMNVGIGKAGTKSFGHGWTRMDTDFGAEKGTAT